MHCTCLMKLHTSCCIGSTTSKEVIYREVLLYGNAETSSSLASACTDRVSCHKAVAKSNPCDACDVQSSLHITCIIIPCVPMAWSDWTKLHQKTSVR